MAFKVEEFNPSKPVLSLGKLKLNLSLVTLQKEVKFIEKYGSLQKALDSIRSETKNIFFILWELLEDKNTFDNNYSSFQLKIITSNISQVEVGKELQRALDECIVKSMPFVKNAQRHADIQKIKNQGESKPPCYVSYYDAIAKRYGYTIEQFYNLTLRQLHLLLKTMDKKLYEELETEAALHGMKMKPRLDIEEISEEEQESRKKQAMDAVRRLREEYEKNKKLKELEKDNK